MHLNLLKYKPLLKRELLSEWPVDCYRTIQIIPIEEALILETVDAVKLESSYEKASLRFWEKFSVFLKLNCSLSSLLRFCLLMGCSIKI